MAKRVDTTNWQQLTLGIPCIPSWQGECGKFSFFTLDDVNRDFDPYICVCIKNDYKTSGRLLNDVSNDYKDYIHLVSIKLKNREYNIDNLEFLEVFNKKYTSKRYKYLYIRFLNNINKIMHNKYYILALYEFLSSVNLKKKNRATYKY